MVKRITVRADAGNFWGYGHIQRTLTVTNRLVEIANPQVRYLMNTSSDATLVENYGYDVLYLNNCNVESILQATTVSDGPLIIDTYSIMEEDLLRLHHKGFCVIVFEDGRRLDHYPANLVVDYSPNAKKLKYQGNSNTKFCLGTKYFPLRKEFIDKQYRFRQKQKVKNITITFGGSDPERQTERFLKILSQHQHNWKITAVIGPGYSGKIINLDCKNNVQILRNVSNMAEVLKKADLVISSSGCTSLELAHLGIPSILVILSQDQEPIAQELDKANVAVCLGWFNKIDDHFIWQKINEVSSNRKCLNQMNKSGPEIVDGKGAARTSDVILSSWLRFLNLQGK